MADSTTEEEVFKKPGPYNNADEETKDGVSSHSETKNSSSDSSRKKKSEKTQVNVPLPYTEPNWSGFPPPNYTFEIIKNGTVVSNLDIKASCLVFGRLDICDVIFEHPSVSRYHAVVQYCKGDDSHPKGFYLFDLGSTHGTFLNKEKVSPNVYYKLKTGYIVKFGGSSRLHIFQGPEEEETEPEEVKKKESNPKEDACSWGMGEDAVEEDDLSINPFSMLAPNEELYVEDPKKTLRGWFEREGYELEYNVEEKGFKSFTCSIQLPVDTPTGEYLPVEATVKGKKKEAVLACALEACRTLDRMGVLRQSHQDSKLQKRKKWEENDYYDSDEDTFYDRTGEIEKRREMRRKLTEKKPEVENFQSLQSKLDTLNEEITTIEKKLSLHTAQQEQQLQDANDDSLEQFMSSLTQTSSDKFEKRRLKLRLVEAQKEREHLEKLLNIVRPAKMPAIVKHSAMVGKRLKSRLQLDTPKVTSAKKVEVVHELEVEEDESDSEMKEESDVANAGKHLDAEEKTDSSKVCSLSETADKEPKKYGLSLPMSDKITCPDTTVNFTDMKTNEIENTKMDISDCVKVKIDILNEDSVSNEVLSVKNNRNKKLKKEKSTVDVYKSGNKDYSTWVPPSDQCGDGMTHLNAKYGY